MRPYNTKRYPVTFFFIALLVSGILYSSSSYAQANLLITPKRLVFDGTKRSEELNLVNIGKDTTTYLISFIQNRMRADGSFESITDPDSAQYFADKNLRFFPRSVTLAPDEVQTVKVQLIKSNELSAGEYRSHLYFRGLQDEKPLGEQASLKDSGISLKITPVFGLSIPTIIRVGENDTKITLSNVSLKTESAVPVLEVIFNRTGNMSVYGDVTVDHISTKGKRTRAAIIKGMAVYTPNAVRNVKLPLDAKAGINYNEGKLEIVYADQSAKAIKMAETELNLSNNITAAN